MNLTEINTLHKAHEKLLNERLNTRVAFKLAKNKQKLAEELQPVIDTLQKLIKENNHLSEAELMRVLVKEEDQLMQEESELKLEQLATIQLTDLPEVEGTIIEGLLPIIEE